MKITGTITHEDETDDFSKMMAHALSPDNLLNMEYNEIKEHVNSIKFEFKKITSAIVSMDDFFMNAKIAEEIYKIYKSIKSTE